MIRIGLLMTGIVIGTATPGDSPEPGPSPGPLPVPPDRSADGLWKYSHARCPEADVVPQGYSSLLVIQGAQASQESAVPGCASQTRILERLWTTEGTVLRYTGATTTCTPGPLCFGSFTSTVAGRVVAGTFSCSTGAAAGESAPYTLESANTLVSPVPGERGCVSVWTRIPGPGGLVP